MGNDRPELPLSLSLSLSLSLAEREREREHWRYSSTVLEATRIAAPVSRLGYHTLCARAGRSHDIQRNFSCHSRNRTTVSLAQLVLDPSMISRTRRLPDATRSLALHIPTHEHISPRRYSTATHPRLLRPRHDVAATATHHALRRARAAPPAARPHRAMEAVRCNDQTLHWRSPHVSALARTLANSLPLAVRPLCALLPRTHG